MKLISSWAINWNIGWEANMERQRQGVTVAPITPAMTR